jgi:hypothetical protein
VAIESKDVGLWKKKQNCGKKWKREAFKGC